MNLDLERASTKLIKKIYTSLKTLFSSRQVYSSCSKFIYGFRRRQQIFRKLREIACLNRSHATEVQTFFQQSTFKNIEYLKANSSGDFSQFFFVFVSFYESHCKILQRWWRGWNFIFILEVLVE